MENSPLKKLPPELRNRVYEFVLLKKPLDSKTPPSTIELDLETSRLCVPTNALALLGTCKQIQQEANKIFYSNHIFKISENPLHTNRLQCKADLLRLFLGRLRPETRMALKHLQMQSLWVHESRLLRRFQHISTHLNLDSFVCSIKAYDSPFDTLDFENSRSAILDRARTSIAKKLSWQCAEMHRIKELQEPKDVCLSCAQVKSEEHTQKVKLRKPGLLVMWKKQRQRSGAPKVERWPEWPEHRPWWAICLHS